MKTVAVLILLGFVCPALASYCGVNKGHLLQPVYRLNNIPTLQFPCKYNFLDMKCGDYKIKITLGNVYLAPRFYLDTIRVRVRKGSDYWIGRTTNNITLKYLFDDFDEPFVKTGGNLNTSQVFDFTKDTRKVFGSNQTNYGQFEAWAKGRQFVIFFRPYLDSFGGFDSIRMYYFCTRSNNPPPFPRHLCGRDESCELAIEAARLDLLEDGLYTPVAGDKTIYYHVFTDNKTKQSLEPRCSEVVNTMLTNCTNEAERVLAIDLCYSILHSTSHRLCAAHNSYEIIDVFNDCVKIVCSGFQDTAACQALNDFIGKCQDLLPALSDVVNNC